VTFINDTSRSSRAQVRPLALERVKLGGFMGRYNNLMRSRTLISQYELLESTGRLDNFRRAAGKIEGDFKGFFFNDSDVYKWLEAASYALIDNDDPELMEKIALTIDVIRDAQNAGNDGYLDTYFTFEKESERWTDFKNMHELYCAGHLIQAAIAHRRVTGSEDLFAVALKFVDHIVKMFGKNGRETTTGHPELEMALVELYRETGTREYLELASRLIDNRGKGLAGGDEYRIDHVPFRQLKELTGHAVRMLYLVAGAADVFLETGDETLLAVIDRLWADLVGRKMYITGGAGSRHEGESFGEAFELPNRRAYTETCAAIASFFWNWRMYMISGDGKYLDVMERTLYNGVLPGISLDGLKYFYVNPLEDIGNHERKEWYSCACCPPNIARLLTSFGGYMYGLTLDEIRVNFYETSEAVIPFRDGEINISQKTGYPNDGEIELTVSTDLDMQLSILLRIPGWTEGEFNLQIDGIKQKAKVEKGFIKLTDNWKGKTSILLDLPMEINMITSNPMVRENTYKIAIERGPLVYCAEGRDNEGFSVWALSVPVKRGYDVQMNEELPGGYVTISGKGIAYDLDEWEGALYKPLAVVKNRGRNVRFTLIPYYAWNNRGSSPMCVWLHIH